MDNETIQLLRDVRDQLAVALAWPDCHKLRSRIKVAIALAEDGKDKFSQLQTAAGIAQTTLETVYRERDPQNVAAKCAAERLANLLA
jgi:hypothetical protein